MSHLLPCHSVHAYAAFVIGIVCALNGGGLPSAAADESRASDVVAWRVGKDFQRQLQLPSSLSWSDQSLRRGLTSLAKSQQIAIWLDRRIDPDGVISITTRGETLLATLRQIAEELGVGVGFVGDVVYIGPKPVATRLATIAAIKRQATETLPSETRSRWQRAQPFRWEALTSPHELLDRLVEEVNVSDQLKVVQAERLPHDLWASGDYPPLRPTDRLTLLLAGFDLSFDMARDGTAIRIASMPESVSISRTFSPPNALRAEQRFRREFPHVKIARRGNRLTATGRFEDLELIGRLLRGENVNALEIDPAKTRFTLTVETAPLGAVIAKMQKERNLTVEIDSTISDKLQTLVTFSVQEVTLSELLEAALKPVGIDFRLNGSKLKLMPAKPR
jgi:hypothetical protein